MTTGNGADLTVQSLDPGEDVATGSDKSFEDRHELGRNGEVACDDFLGAPLEPTNALAEHDPEGLEQTTDLVLKPNPHAHQGIAGSQQRPGNIGAVTPRQGVFLLLEEVVVQDLGHLLRCFSGPAARLRGPDEIGMQLVMLDLHRFGDLEFHFMLL